jgi:hypothetical protein
MFSLFGQYGRKASVIVKRHGQYGRNASWRVKRCEKYGSSAIGIVIRYVQYGRNVSIFLMISVFNLLIFYIFHLFFTIPLSSLLYFPYLFIFQLSLVKIYEKMGRKVGWIVKLCRKYGRKVS